jgi:hypothetical protein
VPAGSEAVVINGGSGLTVSDRASVLLPPALSVTLTVKELAPTAANVPLRIPVDAARLMPWGRLPCDIVQVTGGIAPVTAKTTM